MDGRKTSVGSRRSRLLIRKVLGESSDERFSASSTKPKRIGGASLTPRFFLHPAENLRACTTVVSRSDASGLFVRMAVGGWGKSLSPPPPWVAGRTRPPPAPALSTRKGRAL